MRILSISILSVLFMILASFSMMNGPEGALAFEDISR